MKVKDLLETLKDVPEGADVYVEAVNDPEIACKIEILHTLYPDGSEDIWSVTIL